ncbi:hypothetical protein [Paenibacillus chitinolyticus]|uniref:hypothetical protein n=1 Tax=Paenibacillus chitinolyticus TaxID=79263 RepID=UPI00366DA141
MVVDNMVGKIYYLNGTKVKVTSNQKRNGEYELYSIGKCKNNKLYNIIWSRKENKRSEEWDYKDPYIEEIETQSFKMNRYKFLEYLESLEKSFPLTEFHPFVYFTNLTLGRDFGFSINLEANIDGSILTLLTVNHHYFFRWETVSDHSFTVHNSYDDIDQMIVSLGSDESECFYPGLADSLLLKGAEKIN